MTRSSANHRSFSRARLRRASNGFHLPRSLSVSTTRLMNLMLCSGAASRSLYVRCGGLVMMAMAVAGGGGSGGLGSWLGSVPVPVRLQTVSQSPTTRPRNGDSRTLPQTPQTTHIRFGIALRLVDPRFVFTTSQTCSSRSISSVSARSAVTFSWCFSSAFTAFSACARSIVVVVVAAVVVMLQPVPGQSNMLSSTSRLANF